MPPPRFDCRHDALIASLSIALRRADASADTLAFASAYADDFRHYCLLAG